MTPPDGRSLDLVRPEDDLVTRVVRAVETRWGAGGRPDGCSPEACEACLRAIAPILGGERSGPVDPTVRTETAFAETVRALAIATMEDAGPADERLELLARLVPLEGDRPDRDPEERGIATLLRGPDAFELLVEIAHDFRSPLTSILFLAEALRDGYSGEVTPLQRSQLGLIYSAAFGLSSLSADLTDIARREEDLVGPYPEPYRIEDIFEGIARLVRPIVEEKSLELRITLPDVRRAYGHPGAIQRVLLNLVTNALKFTETGWVEVGAAWRPRHVVEYFVQDTGRGIPPDRLPELFAPFKRRLGEEHGPDGRFFFSGSGIGLSIARRLVDAMGGELTLERSDGGGTRFSFRVSAAEPRDSRA